MTLAENSATTAKKAAASASADAKNAQDNASSAKEAADQITFIANGCKGYYSTAQDLRDAHPTAVAGSWAIVAENSTIWVWNPATSAWKDSSVNVDFSDYYKKSEADAKFGTPYSLPAATVSTLGGVKVGDYLDIAADGTLSGKTLNDKIAAAVAVKSEPRLVWNHYEETGKKWKTYDIKMPDGLDYVHVKTKYNSSTGGYGEEVDIAKGGTANHSYGNGTGIFASNTTFQTNGTLHFATESSTGGYTVEIWLTGYHYPTLADLLTQVTAVESSVTDLQVALCELYEEKEEN